MWKVEGMKYLVVKNKVVRIYDSREEAEEDARIKTAFSEAVGEGAFFTVEEVEE